MDDSDWKQLKSEDLKNNLDKVPDASKLNQQELSKALKEKYGSNLQVNSLPSGSKIQGDTLIVGETTINLKELDGTHTIETKNGKLFIDGKELIKAENVKSTQDGTGIQMDSVETFQSGTTVITGGVNVEVYGDRITADHVDTFTKDGSVAGNVDNLDSTKE